MELHNLLQGLSAEVLEWWELDITLDLAFAEDGTVLDHLLPLGELLQREVWTGISRRRRAVRVAGTWR